MRAVLKRGSSERIQTTDARSEYVQRELSFRDLYHLLNKSQRPVVGAPFKTRQRQTDEDKINRELKTFQTFLQILQ